MSETKKTEKSEPATVGMGTRVDALIYHRLKILAARHDVKPGRLVEQALIEYLDRHENEEIK